MAKNKIGEYSATPANNTDIANIDINEGCSPSGINNAIRELMADLKDWQAGNDSGQALAVVSGGTGSETAAGARTNLGAAKSGENSDITSLIGLTTPISVAQGGTGYVANRSISAVGRASNVVTIQTTAAHGYVVNDVIAVTAVTNTSVNGTFTIASVPSATSFTYSQVGSDYANTADTGTTVSSSFLRADNVSGVIPVIHGGTGASSLKTNNLLVGNGTSAPSVIPAGSTNNVLKSSATSTVTAGSFVVGTEYTIASVGSTNFVAIGAASNTVGVVFTATNAGSGDGTATTNVWVSGGINGAGLIAATVVDATNGGANNLTSLSFTSIPSWVKRITLSVSGLSYNATANPIVRLGVGGSSVTSGYIGSGITIDTDPNRTGYTTGFAFKSSGGASDSIHGVYIITKLTGNTWVASFSGVDYGTNVGLQGAGTIALGGTLDSLFITTTAGTATFDSGNLNIMYE